MKVYKDVNDYIKDFPPEVQKILKRFRTTIRKAAPKAKERIAYGIPTYKGSGNIVHFGGFATHVSFFPGGRARSQFKELAKYAGGKGTIQFPLDKPIPWGLITKIIKWRVKEDAANA